MTDFSKLGKEPWCGCCSNEQVFRAAEAMADSLVQQHYMKPMCIGSIHTIAVVAEYMLLHVVAGKGAQEMAKGNPIAEKIVPFGVLRGIAMQHMSESAMEICNDVTDFMNEHDKKWEVNFLKKVIAAQELAKADAAFDASKEG